MQLSIANRFGKLSTGNWFLSIHRRLRDVSWTRRVSRDTLPRPRKITSLAFEAPRIESRWSIPNRSLGIRSKSPRMLPYIWCTRITKLALRVYNRYVCTVFRADAWNYRTIRDNKRNTGCCKYFNDFFFFFKSLPFLFDYELLRTLYIFLISKCNVYILCLMHTEDKSFYVHVLF